MRVGKGGGRRRSGRRGAAVTVVEKRRRGGASARRGGRGGEYEELESGLWVPVSQGEQWLVVWMLESEARARAGEIPEGRCEREEQAGRN